MSSTKSIDILDECLETGYVQCYDVKPVYNDGHLEDVVFITRRVTDHGFIKTTCTLKEHLPDNITLEQLNGILTKHITN